MANPPRDPNGLTPAQAAAEYRQGDSTVVIAARWGTNPKQVSRLLERAGCARRTQAEARAASRCPAPGRRGGSHTPEGRARIGAAQARRWEGMSQQQRDSVARQTQLRVRGRGGLERFAASGAARLRDASRDGSRLAARVHEAVRGAGHRAEPLVRVRVPGRSVRTACVVRRRGRPPTAVLVWGPSHFLPVFGGEKLAAQRAADRRATEALTLAGYNVLVVEVTRKSVSEVRLADVCRRAVAELPIAGESRVVTVRA